MTKSGFIWALGAMSGTSLDGVDAAMVLTDGVSIRKFGKYGYRTYTDDERTCLRNGFNSEDDTVIASVADVVDTAHVELLEDFPDAEVIGYHGQTLTHAPDRGVTVQAGRGQALANALGRPVVWDFRTADVRMGGQGAPLAPFYHFALARRLGFETPVAFVNIGGVGNLTWIDPKATSPDQPGACLAFDTGPGNAPIDDLCQARLGLRMDKDGALTRAGSVDQRVLDRFLNDNRYFAQIPPKSLDRNAFSGWLAAVETLSNADAAATLAAGTIAAIVRGLDHCSKPPTQLLITGGGRHNPGLMEMLSGLAPCPVVPVEDHGLDGDMIEAQAFAFLAVRVIRGLSTSAPGTTGVAAPIGGGQLSKPQS